MKKKGIWSGIDYQNVFQSKRNLTKDNFVNISSATIIICSEDKEIWSESFFKKWLNLLWINKNNYVINKGIRS